jgi:4-oxalomesaconate hydratase
MKMVVVSAHAADFVWRCGGTIAAYAHDGWDVHVVCVSVGVRGESESLWTGPDGLSANQIEEVRIRESQAAAAKLGATIEFMDLNDHPLTVTPDTTLALARILRQRQPQIVLTHYKSDLLSPDHPATHVLTADAIRLSVVKGTFPDSKPAKMPGLYCFEPDQTSIEMFNPNIYIDITDVSQTKAMAMAAVESQAGLMAPRYTARAEFRASLGYVFGHNRVRQAEAFVQCYPWHGVRFP